MHVNSSNTVNGSNIDTTDKHIVIDIDTADDRDGINEINKDNTDYNVKNPFPNKFST